MSATIIASEGGAGYFPENTAYAVNQSLKQDVDGCELDFHLTVDGTFVAHHDYHLKAALTRDHTGQWLTALGPLIKHSSLAELQQFNFGGINPEAKLALRYPQRKTLAHEPIATLANIEHSFCQTDGQSKQLWFEAKTDPNDLAASTPTAIYAEMLTNALAVCPIRDRIVLIAFDWRLLELVQANFPDLQTGFLTIDFTWFGKQADGSANMPKDKQNAWFGTYPPALYDGLIPKAVQAAGGTYWSPYFRDIVAEDVKQAHDLGIKVSTWGAASEEEVASALATGVDSLTTAYPNRARTWMLGQSTSEAW